MRNKKGDLLVSVMVLENTSWTVIYSDFVRTQKQKNDIEKMVEMLVDNAYNGTIENRPHDYYVGETNDIKETETWYHNNTVNYDERHKVLSISWTQFYR